MVSTAFINIWNRRVGAVAWHAERGMADFEFEPSFLNSGWDIAPLKMPLHTGRRNIYSFPELKKTTTFKGLPGLLADVLPDKYGNALINEWLARNGRPPNSMNPVEMLCFIGKRGMGALEFEPAVPKTTNTATKLEIDSLLSMAQQILSGRTDFHTSLSRGEEKALLDILKVGISAGGARAKAMIAYNETTGEIRSGQAGAPKGFTHWLLKFDGVEDQQLGAGYGYGRVEMAYYLMAKAAGIEMTECRLMEENGRAHFMTRRFDREPGSGKIHVQSFCAIAHYDFNNITAFSYEQLFETMRRLRLPYPEAEQLYRRMAFNVMARNCDDHTKNFAFTMDKTGVWKLAPAFDVCHAYRPDSIWVSQHSLSINGKRQQITRDDLLQVAGSMNIKKAPGILNQVKDAVNKWQTYAGQTAVASGLKNAVAKTLLPL